MQYLLMIYGTEKDFDTQHKEAMPEYGALRKELMDSGKWVGGNRLQPVATATTVRVRSGKTQVTDGPFAETREQLGGYFLIEAKDLDEATKVAERIPAARYGSIEVRPIFQM